MSSQPKDIAGLKLRHPKEEAYEQKTTRELIPLSEVLPLGTPLSLMVDPTNCCNFRCIFCPTGDEALLRSVHRPKGYMSLELFKKIADDMRAFPDRIKELLLYKDGEPLLNPSIVEMIAYAKARNVAQKVALVTNGSLLTDERINGLLSAGLDAIKISVEHMTDEGYARVARANCSYREIHTRVARLFAERERRSHPLLIDLKVLDIDLAEAERVRFIEDYAPICDYMHFDTLMGWSRSDRKDFTLGQKVSRGMDSLNVLSPERLVCPNPFKTLAVNFDGSVTVCCVDWSHALCVGDVKSEPLTEIWRGERLRTLREVHLRGQRGRYSACANCQYFQGMHPINDLDHHAERLLPLYGLESLSSPLADSRANQDSQSKERR